MKFNLDQKAFAAHRKGIILRRLIIISITLVVLIYLSGGIDDSILLLVSVLVAFTSYSLYSTIRKQKVTWQSFELSVEEETITRTQMGHPDIRLAKNEVLGAVETSQGGFVIKTANEFIAIPGPVTEQDRLREVLSDITEVQKQEKPYRPYAMYGYLALIVVAMIVFFMAESIYIILPLGLVFTGGLIYSFVAMQRSRHFSKSLKRSALFVVLPLFFIIAKVWVTLQLYMAS
ncbi:hypothetical protein AB9P05_10510 [Roseivirga sp. BDSF3-8]|uniref:hypothetical protein n=1 Tax=Roseivirga sp. BDSF3-8 TaxID=3241598 RepID=UPI0035319F3F